MSTSLLYHTFGIRDHYCYESTDYIGGATIFKISRKDVPHQCPQCNEKKGILRGKINRLIQTVPAGFRKIFIQVAVQRVECRNCQKIYQVDIGFADPRVSYTKALAKYVLGLCQYMTIKDVSRHLGLGWDLVKGILKSHLGKRYKAPDLKGLSQIAIDEIHLGKGKYLTIVMDLSTGIVVFVGEGKDSNALTPFWEKIKRKRSVKIKAVAIDMSTAYIKAVSENLPKAKIVFDHFHVIKLFNDRLSKFRRKLFNTTLCSARRAVMKGSRWLLLTASEKLEKKPNYVKRLKSALELNKPLATVYYMKEDLRHLWDWGDRKTASWHLDSWIEMALASGILMLEKFAKTLISHKEGILSYFNFRISTGPLEGTNNKIKTMKRQAYGYRDIDFFKLKIMALHEKKYSKAG